MSRVVLLDRSGNIVRHVTLNDAARFCLNLGDGHYYDAANPTTFVQRGPWVDYTRVACPVQRCTPFAGFACGPDHTFPLHRSRIVAALKAHSAEEST